MASRAVRVAEPMVINEEMVRSCASSADYLPTSSERKEELRTQTELHKLEALACSFKNILQIQSLDGLDGLVKLQLDNNIIEKIENLDHLTNLTWLDLSFNNISKIEGLDKLVQLTDLSLFNNSISKLEGLDSLSSLNMLSVGKNNVSSLEDVMYLRKFRMLKMLTLSGNPIESDADYRNFVIANLSYSDWKSGGHLSYLDYRLVETSEVAAAREQFQDQLLELNDQEKSEAEAREREEERVKKCEMLKSYGIEGIDNLLADMISSNPEDEKMRLLPFWKEVHEEIKIEFRNSIEPFIETKAPLVKRKADEMERFRKVVEQKKSESVQQSIVLVNVFKKRLKRVAAKLDDEEAASSIVGKEVEDLRNSNRTLGNELCELQLQQKDKEDSMINEFEARYGEIIRIISDSNSGFFTTLREILSNFIKKVMEMAMEEIERVNTLVENAKARDKPEFDIDFGDISDDSASFLREKEMVLSSISASQDYFFERLDSKEDQIQTAERSAFASLMHELRLTCQEEDRRRTTEIVQAQEEFEEKIQVLEQTHTE
mmetsp:Transcript_11370/g.25890  ORF Transcript_11370/g.25890 Transcript_11370/m.25890 type:complete len:546 (+) Transcript_11370:38-1675(+)